ncbi:DUF808 domain-containing protein [Motiliproteus sp. SC1-56]|uniref:DUF808 domain-containing protein n=1 Tax=Motiliproteus sp. SC1-56 TaxID=2799565 RepID=UPI001A8DB506|nr:DUF808 domain-containing protein [Motiliproteus sp. SC1-56]
MAGSSLLTLIDDIATLLDDVAVLSKVAAKKTAGVLGDDLALNAEQVSGVRAERELPVVWAVAKGSLLNKVILVPAALAISAFAPWAVTVLLMIGGLYLCFEGVEKLIHSYQHRGEGPADHADKLRAVGDAEVDLVAFEKDKIKGAIRTDFILSAEIIVITLGAVQEAPFTTQLLVVSGLALAITVGVYGIVAAIVKIDDAGLHLLKSEGVSAWDDFKRGLGKVLLRGAPWLMKGLSVVGTAAMFLVGGGILVHGLPFMHHPVELAVEAAHALPAIGGIAAAVTPVLINAVVGILAGLAVFVLISLGARLRGG